MRYGREILFFSVIGIFIASAAVTLLGVVGWMRIEPEYLKGLYGLLMIELGAAVLGLFKSTDWFGSRDTPPLGTEAIKGPWWQFLHHSQDSGDNALGSIRIDYSSTEHQLAINGEAYTAAGSPFAKFWSVSASLNPAKLELYYFWKGDHESEEEDFSGVGYMRFERESGKRSASRGTGWFTSGNIERAKVTGRRKVELQRMSREDAKIMLSEDVQARMRLVSSVCAKGRKTFEY